MTTASKGASLRPSNFQTGGLLDNVNALVKSCRYCYYDYEGKGQRTFAAHLSLVTDDGKEHDQYYSAGAPESWQPSPDGREAVPLGNQQQINDNSNWAIAIKQLINAGFPEDKLESDCSIFEGLYAFWQRQEGPERVGLPRRRAANPTQATPGQPPQQERPQTILVPTKIHNLPWEAYKSPVLLTGSPVSVATASATPAGSPAPTLTSLATPATPTGDLRSKTTEFIRSQLFASGGSVAKAALARAVFSELPNDPDRNAITKMIFEPGFLESLAQDGIGLQGDQVVLTT